MICKTRGIVLRALAFQETSLIVSMYTLDYGRRDFIVKGARGPRAHRKHGLYQLLHELDIVFYDKPGRELQLVQESSLASHYRSLTSHPVKLVYGMLLAEVFERTVREHEANPPLYAFLSYALLTMDAASRGLFPLAVHALLHLTAHLGFFPHVEAPAAGEQAFDLDSGRLAASAGVDSPAAVLAALAQTDEPADAQALAVPPALRRPTLLLLLRFYALHVAEFRTPRSLDIFEQVFTDEKG